MTTHFIEAEMDWQESPADLQREIIAELERRGDLLRWAITNINPETQKVTVEAVVTTNEKVEIEP
ncbi:MAG: hypothetical protein NZ772_17760 [Cyanobacteria bacterium]|nr:hypothetical protein [Cyanobacteriota bacterium]MDW8203125.1 hypothetical protein [Cyanobacteriota bacterium SKYGB_h_bin112]